MAPWPHSSSQQVKLGNLNIILSTMKVKTRPEGQNSVPSFSRPRAVPRVLLLKFNGINANTKSIFLCGYEKTCILLIQSRSGFSKPVGLSLMFGIKDCLLWFIFTSTVRPSRPLKRQVLFYEEKGWVGLIGISLIRSIGRRSKDTALMHEDTWSKYPNPQMPSLSLSC